MNEKIEALLWLSHEIGREDRQLAILGEGNTSVKLSPEQFAVKASGAHLGALKESDVTVCAGLLTDKHNKSAAMVAGDREVIFFSFELLYPACRAAQLRKADHHCWF